MMTNANEVVTKPKQTASDHEWFEHCKDLARLHDVKANQLRQDGWKQSGPHRQPRFTRDGETVELRRQLGSDIWYTVVI